MVPVMPTPDFILALRRKIGHDLIWLPGVTAVVLDDVGSVLLNRRVDSGAWAPICGIVEPGEQPADCAAREVLEETGVSVEVQRLASVASRAPSSGANGDRAQFLDLTFRCAYRGGDPRVADDESLDVSWFRLDALPALAEHHLWRIQRATALDEPTWFAAPATPVGESAATSGNGDGRQ